MNWVNGVGGLAEKHLEVYFQYCGWQRLHLNQMSVLAWTNINYHRLGAVDDIFFLLPGG